MPSYGYQFAFAPKPDWSHIWATGAEIRRYHRDLIDALQLQPHLRLGCEVTSAVFDARTPQWVMWMPMRMRQPRFVSRILRNAPRQDKSVRLAQLVGSDYLVDLVIRPTWRRRLAQRYGRICLRILLQDRELRAELAPDYQPFCKRQVLSGDYYRRISRPNASFVSEPTAEVTTTGLRTTDGVHHDLDAIVLATGFEAHNYMRPMVLYGRDGLSIDDAWAKSPRAWGMTAIPGFPNLFMVLGPNSPTGSRSLQHVAELTARYITGWLRRFREGELSTVEITEEATSRFADDDYILTR